MSGSEHKASSSPHSKTPNSRSFILLWEVENIFQLIMKLWRHKLENGGSPQSAELMGQSVLSVISKMNQTNKAQSCSALNNNFMLKHAALVWAYIFRCFIVVYHLYTWGRADRNVATQVLFFFLCQNVSQLSFLSAFSFQFLFSENVTVTRFPPKQLGPRGFVSPLLESTARLWAERLCLCCPGDCYCPLLPPNVCEIYCMLECVSVCVCASYI